MRSIGFVVGLLLPSTLCVSQCGAMQLQFNPTPGMDPVAIAAFERAGELWESAFTDDITVVINIDFAKLDPMVLGSTGSEKLVVPYATLNNALAASVNGPFDQAAYAAMAPSPAVPLLINRTKDNPNGPGSATPYLDDNGDSNNAVGWLTRANAKAVGLIPPHDLASDAAITFSTEFLFDFEPDDGIDPNHMSFVAVAAHEIGHVLGFVSGVDILDGNAGGCNAAVQFYDAAEFQFVSPEDLLRRSAESVQHGPHVSDWTADRRPKYFALGSPTDQAGGFSTGRCFGDSQQASHWKDELGLGLMDPTLAPGDHLEPGDLDLSFYDAIGYERATPEAADAKGGAVLLQAANTILLGPDDLTVTSDAAGGVLSKFSFDLTQAEPLVTMSYSGGLVDSPEDPPFLQIFGDGLVRVQYPVYTKRAGVHERHLSQEELAEVISGLVDGSVAQNKVLDLRQFLTVVPTLDPVDPVATHDLTAEVTINVTDVSGNAESGDRTIILPSDALQRSRLVMTPAGSMTQAIESLEDLAESISE